MTPHGDADPAVFLAELSPGDELADFLLLDELGRGAFATVFLANQRSLQRLVALKVALDDSPEARTLAQLDHERIVRVYDEIPAPVAGLRLLYMEYVPGGTLGEVLARVQGAAAGPRTGATLLAALDATLAARGVEMKLSASDRAALARRDWGETIATIGEQLASALAVAHVHGVLHRDIKPANVLLDAAGGVKLSDFNLGYSARLDLDAEGAFGGSLPYMSPEQMDAFDPTSDRTADSLDAKSDLFSLAVMLWELLTGARPFVDPEPEDGVVFYSSWAASRRRRIPREVRDAAIAAGGADLVAALLRCLEPEPAARIESAADLFWALQLSRRPRARRLFSAPASGWRASFALHPVAFFVAATVIPSSVATGLNILYNRASIIARQPESAERDFNRVTMIVNSIAFPVGVAIVGAFAAALRAALAGRSPAGVPDEEVPRRAGVLPDRAALVVAVLWAVSGIGFPIGMDLAGSRLEWSDYLHFLVSLAICGLLAGCGTFFFSAFVLIRGAAGRLWDGRRPSPAAVASLGALHRGIGRQVWISAAVPMLAILALASFGTQERATLVVLAGVCLLTFASYFQLAGSLQNDLVALARAMRGLDEAEVADWYGK